MSNAIEKAVTDYIDNKKDEEVNFSRDAVSVAKEVDHALDDFKHDYEKLKDRIRKDYSLTREIEDLVKKATDHIIKPY